MPYRRTSIAVRDHTHTAIDLQCVIAVVKDNTLNVWCQKYMTTWHRNCSKFGVFIGANNSSCLSSSQKITQAQSRPGWYTILSFVCNCEREMQCDSQQRLSPPPRFSSDSARTSRYLKSSPKPQNTFPLPSYAVHVERHCQLGEIKYQDIRYIVCVPFFPDLSDIVKYLGSYQNCCCAPNIATRQQILITSAHNSSNINNRKQHKKYERECNKHGSSIDTS